MFEPVTHILAGVLMLLQTVSANPSLPQSARDQVQIVLQQAITVATRAIAQNENGVSDSSGSSCTLVADKLSYRLGEVLVFDWKIVNATSAEFVPDMSGNENLPVPRGELLGMSGQYRKVAPARGYPFLTMRVKNEKGQSATCSEMVYVY